MHRLIWLAVFFREAPWRIALCTMAFALSMNFDGLGRDARAAELEGFGPVKFGMTVAQAKEALISEFGRLQADQLLGLERAPFFDETSLKIEDDRLSYRIFIEDLDLRFKVFHGFREGRASHAFLGSLPRKKDRERCTTLGWTLARGIEEKHGVSPGIRIGKLEEGFEEEFVGRVVDVFIFMFESGAYIKMETIWEIDDDCYYYIGYELPHRNITQF